MKPKPTEKLRLKLDRERVRALAGPELHQVMGGLANVPNQTKGDDR